jgi:hypothetical protein
LTPSAIPFAQHTFAGQRLAPMTGGGQVSRSAKCWKEMGIMATNEVDRSSEIYVKVVGTLMVLLLAYGALTLLGVVR